MSDRTSAPGRRIAARLAAAVIVATCMSVQPRVFTQSGVDVLATDQGEPGPVIIDANRIYWSELTLGTLHSTTIGPRSGVFVHSSPNPPLSGGDLAQDDEFVYFVQTGGVASGVFRSRKAVFGANQLYRTARGVGIAMDPDKTHLYFLGAPQQIPLSPDFNCPLAVTPGMETCTPVLRMPKAGGTTTVVAYLNQGESAGTFSTNTTNIYWADHITGQIRTAPIVGAFNQVSTLLLAGRPAPGSITSPSTGPAAGSIFWVEGLEARVMRRDASGNVTMLLDPGPTFCTFQCLAVRDGFVFTEQGGRIVSVPIGGGPVTVTATTDPGDTGRMTGIAIDGSHVYWGTTTGKIMRVATSIAPGPPTNLQVAVSPAMVVTTWDPPVGGGTVANYRLDVGSGPGLSNLGSFHTPATTRTYTLNGVPNGTYYLRVHAYNGAGISLPSNEVVATVGATLTAPAAPTSLAASVSGSSVSLTWHLPTVGSAPSDCRVEAGSATGLSDIATVSVGVASTFGTTGVPSGSYYVRVRCSNAAGVSGPSNEVIVVVGSLSAVPSPPTGLTASRVGSTVTLSWIASPTGGSPTTFIVEAGSQPGLANLATVSTGGAGTTFTATGVPDGLYFVRVRAANAAGTSAPSPETSLLVVNATCSGQLTTTLTWNTGTATGSPTRVDMDLHVTEPDGTHVYGGNFFGGRTVRMLEDNNQGRGPETICATGAPADGVYQIDAVAYLGNEFPTTATIAITTASGTVSFTRVFQAADPTLAQRVATVTFPGAIVTEVSGTRAIDRR